MKSFSIYMSKQFIPYQCCLLAIKCFFFSCQFTCTIFIHQEGLVMSLGWLRGSLGTDRRRNNTAADNFFIPNAEEFFASILSIFSQCTACVDVRDGDQAELFRKNRNHLTLKTHCKNKELIYCISGRNASKKELDLQINRYWINMRYSPKRLSRYSTRVRCLGQPAQPCSQGLSSLPAPRKGRRETLGTRLQPPLIW